MLCEQERLSSAPDHILHYSAAAEIKQKQTTKKHAHCERRVTQLQALTRFDFLIMSTARCLLLLVFMDGSKTNFNGANYHLLYQEGGHDAIIESIKALWPHISSFIRGL